MLITIKLSTAMKTGLFAPHRALSLLALRVPHKSSNLFNTHSSFVLPLLATCLAGNLAAQSLSNYQFIVSSQSPSAYFKLDGTVSDSITPSQSFSTSGGYFVAHSRSH